MFGLTTRNNNQGLRTYNPFREMEELEKAFFSNPFGSFWGNAGLEEFKTDVTDEGDHYLLEADLPGFEKKDITLDIQGNTLTVHAERHSRVEEKDQKDKVIRMERSYGSYTRSFDISGVDTNHINAKYDKFSHSLKARPPVPGEMPAIAASIKPEQYSKALYPRLTALDVISTHCNPTHVENAELPT